MANLRWQGRAAAIAQVQSWLFAGTWLTSETITVTIGSKAVTVTTGSATIATLLATLQVALSALSGTSYPEFAEVTWTSNSTHLLGTAVTAGKSFIATVSTNSASGTVDGGASSTGTSTTASAGPNNWSTAANWSTGAVPVSTDNVTLDFSADDIKDGLAQSAVTLTSLTIAASFTGTLGLPEHNTDATEYEEYRPRYLKIGATTTTIGQGTGNGSGRLLLDNSSIQTTLNVYATASALDTNLEAIQWKGTHASNAVTVMGGDVGIAGYGGDLATVATLRLAEGSVRCGSGATLTTVTATGGSLLLSAAATTLNAVGGSVQVIGTGAYTTVNVIPAPGNRVTLTYQSTGTVTTLNVTGGVVDYSQDLRSRTVTSTNLYAGASLFDPYSSVSFSNPIQLVHCGIQDVILNAGTNRTLAIAGSGP